jgi:uncharacterized cupredoxin-like copper-binding protein
MKQTHPRRFDRRAAITGIAAAATVATMPFLAATARAHGDATHAKKRPVRKEQKAWGIAGERKAAKRTIDVRMLDTMRFDPDRIDVKLGETLRFRVANTGTVMHEFVIGTKQENEAHAALMMKFPTMQHDEPHMAHVAPGKAGEIVWTFNRPGTFEFACLIAGHYQSGMVGKITVSAK